MNPNVLYQWMEEMTTHLPSLSVPQARNAALFSYGVVLAQDCRQHAIARHLTAYGSVSGMERRLQRFLSNVHLSVEQVAREWTAWVLQAWVDKQEVVLLVDETKLADHLAVMMVGIAYRQRCIPLIWRCYRANDASSYPAEGQAQMIGSLLRQIASVMPLTTKVMVQADRGIGTSPALIGQVEALGWYYLFRITRKSKIVCDEETEYTIHDMVAPGEIWQAQGKVFKQRGQIPARALALWSQGYAEPWALVTNAPNATGWEYAQRNWQEQGFRDLKSGGWMWGNSQVWQPEHAARLLLLLTCAYAWMVAVGTCVLLKTPRRCRRDTRGERPRQSVFQIGLDCFYTGSAQAHWVCLKLLFISDKPSFEN